MHNGDTLCFLFPMPNPLPLPLLLLTWPRPRFFPRLVAALLVWLALPLLLLLCGPQHSRAELRDPQEKQFIVWPNIPVIRAADFAELGGDRKIFADLHAGKADPATTMAALQAVDQLQAHHERAALADLGRSLNILLISELDRLARTTANGTPKLRFDFADIRPSEIQRPALLDAPTLATLKARLNQITLLMYITYARMEGSTVQATVTVVKLADGLSQSFTVTAPAAQAGAALAQELFHYFYGTRFAPYRNPMPHREWVQPAPSHTDQMVTFDMAQRYCRSQNAELPSAEELDVGQAAGVYHQGIEVKSERLYHTGTAMHYQPMPLTAQERVLPNRNLQGSNAYYYCIRSRSEVAAPAPARSAKANKAAKSSANAKPAAPAAAASDPPA